VWSLSFIYFDENVVFYEKLHGAMINAYKILVGKHEGKRPLGRPRCKWEDIIIMHLREVWWEGVEWIHVAQDRD
jgi:hypothetical protein